MSSRATVPYEPDASRLAAAADIRTTSLVRGVECGPVRVSTSGGCSDVNGMSVANWFTSASFVSRLVKAPLTSNRSSSTNAPGYLSLYTVIWRTSACGIG